MEAIISVWLAECCEQTLLAEDEDTLAWIVTEDDWGELEERLNAEMERQYDLLMADIKHTRNVIKQQQQVKDTLMEVIERIAAIG